MEVLYTSIQQHRRLCFGLAVGFSIFIGCFAFPFINLTKEWPVDISILNIMIVLVAYYDIGVLFGVLYCRNSIFQIVFLNIGLAFAGMVCRFLLEFGEVSNSYNFTWPNILLQLLVVTVFTSAISFLTGRKISDNSK